jgi:hypothetical protein
MDGAQSTNPGRLLSQTLPVALKPGPPKASPPVVGSRGVKILTTGILLDFRLDRPPRRAIVGI